MKHAEMPARVGRSILIVKIESFEGEDTHLYCGDDQQDYLYCVIAVDESGDAEVVDGGYRSREEAQRAWG